VVVTVYGDAGVQSTTTITTDDILGKNPQFPPDVVNAQYQTRAVPNGPKSNDPLVGQGLSIRQLVQHLSPPISPGSVTYTQVTGRSAYQSNLSSSTHDFDDPNDPDFPFERGLEPAFFPITGQSNAMGYIRPLRADDASDVNNRDYMETDPGGALRLDVHTSGTLLQPEITAAPHSIKPGGSVAFKGSVSDPDSSETVTWTWTFGDGAITDAQGPHASHLYSAPGTYFAFADVSGSNGSSGESAPVQITVTAPRSTSTSPAPTPRTSTTPPPTGHSHGTGGSHNPTSGPTGGNGHHGGGAPQSSAVNSTQPGRGSESVAPAPIPVGPPADGTPSGAATGADNATASNPSAAGSATTTHPEGQVSGYLIAGLAAVPISAAPSTRESHRPLTAPAARDGIPPPWRISVWLLVAAGAVMLFIAGAAREARRPARRTNRRHA
jgi:hypothetical protein